MATARHLAAGVQGAEVLCTLLPWIPLGSSGRDIAVRCLENRDSATPADDFKIKLSFAREKTKNKIK